MCPSTINTYLNSFINYEIDRTKLLSSGLKLDRMKALLDLLGNPQERLKFIHVAGSKGKGSVCSFTANILKEVGYTVGLYTSPHIKDVNERIRVLSLDGTKRNDCIFEDSISDQELEGLLDEMKPQLETLRSTKEHGPLSYFEVLTALSFCFFANREVDYVVCETGLGGRFDATNVIDSIVCAITSISFEHTRQLGNTLKSIAFEKSAIIKDTSKMVVCAPQEIEAFYAINKRCEERGSKCLLVGRDINYKAISQNISFQVFEIKGINDKYEIETSLLGKYQIINAAIAVGIIEALQILGEDISKESVQNGIASTVWPARFEVIAQDPTIIVDCAHNPQSARELAESIHEVFEGKKIILVFGVSDDKDRKGILEELTPFAKGVILTKADHPRAVEFSEEETKSLLKDIPVKNTSNVSDAITLALKTAKEDDIILVAGSVFVAGEARDFVLNCYAN